MTRIISPLTALFIFLTVYITHANSPVIQSIDSQWAIPTAVSVVRDGDFFLKEFRPLMKARKNYGLTRAKKGKPHNFFPYGSSLFAVPFVALFEWRPILMTYLVPGASAQLKHAIKVGNDPDVMAVKYEMERAVASFLVACTAVLWFFIARTFLTVRMSALLTLAFAFGTPAWSTASRGLWQHGPVIFLTSLALLLILRVRDQGAGLSGAPLAWGYAVRPTMALPWAITGIYLFFVKRKALLLYLLLSTLMIAIFFYLNTEIYGRLLSKYYQAGRLRYHPAFFEAVAASLFSPNRGLLFQSPFLLMAVFSIVQLHPRSPYFSLILLAFSTITAHLVATSLFPNWWHGHCFGSRYMTDSLPFYFLLFVLIFSASPRIWLHALFITLLLPSIAIHWLGATNTMAYQWNVQPRNIDSDPHRVWNLSDWQPIYGKRKKP